MNPIGVLAGLAFGTALVAYFVALSAHRKASESARSMEIGDALPASVTHVLNYRHLWPTSFERAIVSLVREEIRAREIPTVPPPVRVVIVGDETKVGPARNLARAIRRPVSDTTPEGK